jgi:predicted nuclease of predicted toxin-antitoxin system
MLFWGYAKTNGFTIVSKDSDFNNLVSYFGFPPKIIWLRRGNCSTKIIIEIITENLENIKAFIADTENGILTIF